MTAKLGVITVINQTSIAQTTTAQQPANGEHLMVERVFGGAMKREVVKRLR